MSMPQNRPIGTGARQLEIHAIVGDLEHRSKQVEELSATLSERLRVVLANRPEVTGSSPQPPRSAPVTEIGARLDTVNVVLEAACARMQAIIERLEI